RCFSQRTRSAATRKPRLNPLSCGACVYRSAQRALLASKYQLPPRMTRFTPDVGPRGSMFAPALSLYGAYQSDVHSQTLPVISARPQGFGGNEPTGVGF